jgi:branched-chain amino acid aminotransferase
MFNMDYTPEKGWYNPRIEPHTFMKMDPACMVLHYGQAVFEGLKAYRTDSGNIQLFRPKDNPPGNYAASLRAGRNAKENGYSQVLWLDGIERKYIEEVGAMNIFFVLDDELVTPELSGSILPGVTRDSVLQLAKMWGLKATERKIGIDEVMQAGESGKLQEVFGSGTAAVISPVGKIKWVDKEITIGDGKVGTLTSRFFKAITDIQYGQAEDPFGWVEIV